MHEPNPITLAAKASGEPRFRTVGVGPWNPQEHGGIRPDDQHSNHYDPRFDSTLLNEGDERNVLDEFRYWSVEAIRQELDTRGRHGFEIAVENWTHDFNIGSMVRSANAFAARAVHIVGPHKWNRKGSLMTELYQHVYYHPTIDELVATWKTSNIHAVESLEEALKKANFIVCRGVGAALKVSSNGVLDEALNVDLNTSPNAPLNGRTGNDLLKDSSPDDLQTAYESYLEANVLIEEALAAEHIRREDKSEHASSTTQTIADSRQQQVLAVQARYEYLVERSMKQIEAIRQARVIALDIVPAAYPIEQYVFPERCLMLFGAEGPGLTSTALSVADDVVYIQQYGSVRSINAGAAAAVAMHSWICHHQ